MRHPRKTENQTKEIPDVQVTIPRKGLSESRAFPYIEREIRAKNVRVPVQILSKKR